MKHWEWSPIEVIDGYDGCGAVLNGLLAVTPDSSTDYVIIFGGAHQSGSLEVWDMLEWEDRGDGEIFVDSYNIIKTVDINDSRFREFGITLLQEVIQYHDYGRS